MRMLIADIVTAKTILAGESFRVSRSCGALWVSRGVARECIRAMEERGLISVKHGKGATVNGSELWNMFDPECSARCSTVRVISRCSPVYRDTTDSRVGRRCLAQSVRPSRISSGWRMR